MRVVARGYFWKKKKTKRYGGIPNKHWRKEVYGNLSVGVGVKIEELDEMESEKDTFEWSME